MSERFYWHVGAPKAGTTHLQGVLDANRDALARAGVTVLGPRLDLIHAAMVLREDPRLRDLPATAAEAWSRVAAAVRQAPTPTAVASYELFAGASAERVAAALRDLDGVEVHVVITTRDLARAVPSAWQEQLKFASTTPLEQWRPRPETAGPRAEWAWRTMDPAAVASRWGEALPPERVHVVTVPREAGGDELWHRFARACGFDGVEVDTAVDRTNASLGAVQAELLRRVNARLGEEVVGARQRSLWIRDLLAHEVLARQRPREPLALTPDQLREAEERAERAVGAIEAAGYDVQGDLDDLRPRPWTGRLPGSVDDAELLAAAVEAVADLVLAVRDRSRAVETDDDPGGGRAGRFARTVLGAPGRRQVADLRRRIEALERQVDEERTMQLRIAELSDVVADLLLPAAEDGKVRRKAVMGYRRRSV